MNRKMHIARSSNLEVAVGSLKVLRGYSPHHCEVIKIIESIDKLVVSMDSKEREKWKAHEESYAFWKKEAGF